MIKILPYKAGSASVKKLKEGLDAMILKLEGSKYRYNPTHLIVNWGNSRRPQNLEGVPMLNEPEAVELASNKRNTFEALNNADVSVVPFTTDPVIARDWAEEGSHVFARHTLTGHSGEGIEVIQPGVHEHVDLLADIAQELEHIGLNSLSQRVTDEITGVAVDIPDALLYTKGIPNNGEYRVHVFQGDVILYQKKSRRVDDDGEVITAEGEEALVRNLESNWIYRTGHLARLDRIEALAIEAVEALDLDFGAVDIIMSPDGNVYVLEVNTAPGLGNTETLEAYIEAINNLTA